MPLPTGQEKNRKKILKTLCLQAFFSMQMLLEIMRYVYIAFNGINSSPKSYTAVMIYSWLSYALSECLSSSTMSVNGDQELSSYKRYHSSSPCDLHISLYTFKVPWSHTIALYLMKIMLDSCGYYMENSSLGILLNIKFLVPQRRKVRF